MTIKAITGLIPEWYIPAIEKNKKTATRTRFELTPLDGSSFLEVMTEGEISTNGTFFPNYKGRMILIERGLTNWENFGGTGQKAIAFSLDNISMIPANILAELSSEIMNRSALTSEDKKNSDRGRSL